MKGQLIGKFEKIQENGCHLQIKNIKHIYIKYLVNQDKRIAGARSARSGDPSFIK